MPRNEDIDKLGLFSEDVLFHYTTATIALEHIFYEGRFRLSPFGMTNDPREYKRWSFGMMGWGLPQGEDLQTKWFKADFRTNEYLKLHYKVACFCMNKNKSDETADILELGFAKPRMWSQYSDKQQGVCLVVSKSKLLAYLKSKYQTEAIYSREVDYLEGRSIKTSARTFNGQELSKKELEEFVQEHIRKHNADILFSKGIDYRDEEEFRVVVLDTKNEYIDVPLEEAILGAILGDRFPNWLAKTAELGCEKNGIFVRRIYWYNGTLMLTNRCEIQSQ